MKPILILTLLVFSCSSPENDSSQSDPADSSTAPIENTSPRQIRKEVVAPAQAYNFQYDPKAVVEEVFNAANTKDYSKLSLLVDPGGQSDEPTKNICNVANATSDREQEFIEYFKLGRVIGEPVINGNTAEVQIKFGPDGTKDETFYLVLRNGLWYLGSI